MVHFGRQSGTPGNADARQRSYPCSSVFIRGPVRWLGDCIFAGMLDPIVDRLGQYMDLLSTRQKLVASNIANADTPGYKTQDIDFQFEFMSLVNGQQPQTVQAEGLVQKPDGNNVNMDREARLLAENAMRFNLASTLVRSQLKTVRAAIDEGKNG